LSGAQAHYERLDDVQIHSLSLTSMSCSETSDKPYCLVHFSPVIDGDVLFGSVYFAGVLMDGTVIGPTPTKRDY
jgi:hypothetical protein